MWSARNLGRAVFEPGPVPLLCSSMTRGFASGMRSRERALESSVSAAEEVGELLAGYRTRAATALIDGGAAYRAAARRLADVPLGCHCGVRPWAPRVRFLIPFPLPGVVTRDRIS